MKSVMMLAMVLALCLAETVVAQAQTADEKLNAFFRHYLEDYFRLRPLEATKLGDHRFDALIENLTPESRAFWQEQTRKAVTDLPHAVDYAKLSRPAQIDFEILAQHLNQELWLEDNTHPFEEDPRVYDDYFTGSVRVLFTRSTLPLEINVANAIARMTLIPKVITVARQNLRHPPRTMTETAIRLNRDAIKFYETDLYQYAGRTRQSGALRAAAGPVVSALKDYQKFLESDLLSRSNGDWRLGPDKFARKLELELDAGATADQVFGDAQAEFNQTQDRMHVIARQLWSKYYFPRPLPGR